MAENKKSVLLYCDIITTVEELSDEEAGKLFKHYLRYINDMNPQPPDRLTQLVFEPIKQNLKRDLKTWKLKVKKRSEAGKKGMEKRWHEDNNVIKPITNDNNVIKPITNDNNVIKPITNITDTVTVTDNVTVTVKEINNTPPAIFRIEECLTVAMNDPRWVKANNVTTKDLQEFNRMLEKRGVYDKNPADYKTHYSNWSAGGRKDDKQKTKEEIEHEKVIAKMRGEKV